jgi:hypothetical protein
MIKMALTVKDMIRMGMIRMDLIDKDVIVSTKIKMAILAPHRMSQATPWMSLATPWMSLATPWMSQATLLNV